ncbi:hypothetical protein C2U70_24225 [Bradyrhizobium guangdongense]|nr:hypothetical protein C2U70_24225 [Bradyrhizobium guangdongense]
MMGLLALLVANCDSKAESYRYKLSLAVDTPAGVKRASSVVEVTYFAVSVPDRGVMYRLHGEAVYLDLQPGARPLVALLTRKFHRPAHISDIGWTLDAGPGMALLFKLYGISQSGKLLDDVQQVARLRGPRALALDYLPNLVTFGDVNDPKTVIEVDPNDLQATLGPNVVWREITLESTDEPVTTGIKTKLPWLQQYHGRMLDGDTISHVGARKTFANSLSTADFKFPSNSRNE